MRNTLMITARISLLLIILISPLRAEPLVIPLSIYFSAAATDLHSTHKFLQYQGTKEANPLASWLSEDPKLLITYSAIGDATIVYILHRYWGKKHPKLERVLLYGAAAIRLSLAYDNYKFVEHLQKQGTPLRGAPYIWPN